MQEQFYTIPQQAVVITSRGKVTLMGIEQERDDFAVVLWHMPASDSPPVYAVSLRTSSQLCRIIMQSSVFVVNFMPHSYHDILEDLKDGQRQSFHGFAGSRLHGEEADAIDCLRVGESCGYLECEVVGHLPAGDHTVLVGKVVRSSHRASASPAFRQQQHMHQH